MASSHKTSGDGERIKIDPAGDVLLQVGESESKVQLLVSSKVLGLASPVFAAMLGPNFKEGESLRAGDICQIPLPEDNAEAMTLFCNCIHLQAHRVPATVEFRILKALTIICDKYDASRSVMAWSTLWLQKCEKSSSAEDYEGLLCLAHALDCAIAFKEFSKTAIMAKIGPLDTSWISGGFYMVPEKVLVDHSKKKDAITHLLQRKIEEEVIMPMLSVTNYKYTTCPYRAYTMYTFFRELQECGLWPLTRLLQEKALVTVSLNLLLFQDSNTVRKSTESKSQFHCDCTICATNFSVLLRGIRAEVIDTIEGFCLDCVKAGGSRTEEDMKSCRVPHS